MTYNLRLSNPGKLSCSFCHVLIWSYIEYAHALHNGVEALIDTFLYLDRVLINTYPSLTAKAMHLSKDCCFKQPFSSRYNVASIRRCMASRLLGYFWPVNVLHTISHLFSSYPIACHQSMGSHWIFLCTRNRRSRPSLFYRNLGHRAWSCSHVDR